MAVMYRIRVATSGWVGGPGLNTFYYQDAADPTVHNSTGAQACVDNVHAALQVLAPLRPTSHSTLVSPEVDVLDPSNGELQASYVATGPAAIGGAGGGSYNAIAIGLLCRLVTAGIVAGHRVKGRAFFSPITPDPEANGTPLASAITIVQNTGDALRFTAGNVEELVVWSRPVTVATETVDVRSGSAHVVDSVVCPDKYVVLRSRRD